ncbi:unnamed protein product, partial [Onchocerca flexuosa]|uniref:Helicase C-terminal domain-containing protein n=1 Tax=Onchocerca flexuosa TaxID=387005 RepID=A0A183I818_9BILA
MVKLIEKVKIDNLLYTIHPEGKLEFEINLGENASRLQNRDPDGLIHLLHDIVPRGSVLIFCPTKQNCEKVCKMISRLMPRYIREGKKTEKIAAIEAIKSEEDGKVSSLLELSIMNGVAYHHGGLTAEERKIIEEAFEVDGIINIICCTSTLAAGINLPVRRVIIKAPFVGKEPLRKAQYLQ